MHSTAAISACLVKFVFVVVVVVDDDDDDDEIDYYLLK